MQEENTGSAGNTSSAEDMVPAEEGLPQSRRRRAVSRAAGPPEGDDGTETTAPAGQATAETAGGDAVATSPAPEKPARARKTATKAAKAPAKKAGAGKRRAATTSTETSTETPAETSPPAVTGTEASPPEATALEAMGAETTGAEATGAETTTPAKAPAKKAAAKKTTARKTTAKKAAAAKTSADTAIAKPTADTAPPVAEPVNNPVAGDTTAADPATGTTDASSVDSVASTEPAPAEPRKRAPRKRRSTTAQQAATATDTGDTSSAASQPSIDTSSPAPAEQDGSADPGSPSERAASAAAARAAVLFQPPPAFDATPLFAAPEPVTAPATSTPEVKEAPRTADTTDDAEDTEHTEHAEDTRSGTGDTARGDDGDEGDDGDGTRRRRRRRGGRGRRRRSDGTGDGDTDEAPDDTSSRPAASTPAADTDTSGDTSDTSDDDADTDTDEGDGEGSSRRRRRRRRRKSESDGDERTDDPPNTVVKVRDSRDVDDEVTSVKGSTRLEAKKQRRREGREAGRKRPPILSESEFLARREAVDRVMAVRQSGDLTQIAVLEDDVLVEHYVSRASQQSLIGNVYLGRVQNVLPAMEAAFIDIGRGRNAVLYAGEVDWTGMGKGDGQKRIEDVLKSGQSVLVQVTKDPIGHKGARLTSQISLPGRYVVYVPGGSMNGISRKLPDTERSRLKKILKQVVPDDAGVIVRTAAEGASEDELTNDVSRLQAEWEAIQKKTSGTAPALLHGEPDLAIKVVRDLFNEDFTKLVVSGDRVWDTIDDYVTHVASSLRDRVERWTANGDVFAAYRIDEQIAKAMDRKVWLPSGGSLIIERTEAMTVVDVNTGKFTGSGGNLEETVTRNNLEAAEELVRQLRLRDIGGIIVVDFIDMVLEANRDLVLRRMIECLGRDRTKHQVAEVTSLGLVQMTRKRIGTGLLEAFSEQCPHCKGRGLIVHTHPVDSGAAESGGSGGPGGSGAAGGSGGAGRSGRQERRGRKRKNEPAEKPADVAALKLEAAATPGEASPADLIPVAAEHDSGESGDSAATDSGATDPTARTIGSVTAGAGAAGPDPSRAAEARTDGRPRTDEARADEARADEARADSPEPQPADAPLTTGAGGVAPPRRRSRRRAQRPAGSPETDSSSGESSGDASAEQHVPTSA